MTNIYQQIGQRIVEILTEAEFNRLPPGTIREIQGYRYVLKNSRWHRLEPAPSTAIQKAAAEAKTLEEIDEIRKELRRKSDKFGERFFADTFDYDFLLQNLDDKYFALEKAEDEALRQKELEESPEYKIEKKAGGVTTILHTTNYWADILEGKVIASPIKYRITEDESGYTVWKSAEVLKSREVENGVQGFFKMGGTRRVEGKLPKLKTQSQIDDFLFENYTPSGSRTKIYTRKERQKQQLEQQKAAASAGPPAPAAPPAPPRPKLVEAPKGEVPKAFSLDYDREHPEYGQGIEGMPGYWYRDGRVFKEQRGG